MLQYLYQISTGQDAVANTRKTRNSRRPNKPTITEIVQDYFRDGWPWERTNPIMWSLAPLISETTDEDELNQRIKIEMIRLIIFILILSSCKALERKKQTDITQSETISQFEKSQKGIFLTGTEFLLKSDKLELESTIPLIISINGRDSIIYRTEIIRQIATQKSGYSITKIDTTTNQSSINQETVLIDKSSDQKKRKRFGLSSIVTIILLIIIFLSFLGYKYLPKIRF